MSDTPASLFLPKDDDMDYIYDQLVQDYGAVTFEAFINLLVRPITASCGIFTTGLRRWT